MIPVNNLFKHTGTSLKVCGITTQSDALKLIDLEVPALGFNFWPKSKRYISPDKAASFTPELKDKTLRVGVFVNEKKHKVLELLEQNVIDIPQFHGDETPEYCSYFFDRGVPFIRAIGVQNSNSMSKALEYRASAILLDAHAPSEYGGTGDTFDWNLAKEFVTQNPALPVLLAGGITAENAALAAATVKPTALDLASGSESSPGIKDIEKVKSILKAIRPISDAS